MFKFALLALLSLLVTVKCDAGVPTFPNVGYLGAGYDLMYGNPQTPGHVDPGFRSRVFNLTVYHGDLTPDQRYQVPVGTEIVNCTACSLSFGSQKIDSAYDYAKHLATGVSADFAGWGAKFSASAAYQSVSTATSSSTNSYTSASAECNVYCASIKMYNAPPLTLNFVNAIKQLPADANNRSYIAVIKEFGTHITSRASMGGKFGQSSEFSSVAWANMVTSGLNVNAAAGFSALGASGSAKVMSAEQTKEAKQFAEASTSQSVFTVGGTPPTDGSVWSWIPSAAANPMPISYTLTALVDIMTQENFPGDKAIATKQANMQATMEIYCAYLVTAGGIEGCDAPIPAPAPSDPYKDLLKTGLNNMFNNFHDGCGCSCSTSNPSVCLGERLSIQGGVDYIRDYVTPAASKDAHSTVCTLTWNLQNIHATLQDCTCGNDCAPCVQKYAQSFIKCGDAPALMNDTSRRHFLSLHRHQTEN